jgi:hypothetical protein
MINEKLLASTQILTAGTLVGPWRDVDFYKELAAWINVTAFVSRDDETVDVTIERWSGNTAGYTTLLTFTQATAVTSEEKTAVALIGGRLRYRVVAAGTFAEGTSVTLNIGIQAK